MSPASHLSVMTFVTRQKGSGNFFIIALVVEPLATDATGKVGVELELSCHSHEVFEHKVDFSSFLYIYSWCKTVFPCLMWCLDCFARSDVTGSSCGIRLSPGKEEVLKEVPLDAELENALDQPFSIC